MRKKMYKLVADVEETHKVVTILQASIHVGHILSKAQPLFILQFKVALQNYPPSGTKATV